MTRDQATKRLRQIKHCLEHGIITKHEAHRLARPALLILRRLDKTKTARAISPVFRDTAAIGRNIVKVYRKPSKHGGYRKMRQARKASECRTLVRHGAVTPIGAIILGK